MIFWAIGFGAAMGTGMGSCIDASAGAAPGTSPKKKFCVPPGLVPWNMPVGLMAIGATVERVSVP